MPTRACLTAAALVVATVTALGAGEITTADVGIVLEASASLSQRQLRAMTAETTAIWRPYGVTIRWLTPLQQHEPESEDVRVSVRLPFSPPERRAAGAPTRPLGSVLFVDGIPDGVITVRPETVEALVLAASWNGRPLTEAPRAMHEDVVGRALGRVLAHEIGHYLLAQKGHRPAGLMRASFKSRELVETDRRAFQLQPRDLAALVPRLAQLMGRTPRGPGIEP